MNTLMSYPRRTLMPGTEIMLISTELVMDVFKKLSNKGKYFLLKATLPILNPIPSENPLIVKERLLTPSLARTLRLVLKSSKTKCT